MDNIFAWLAWGFPFIGAMLTPMMGRIHVKVRDYTAVMFSFLGALSSMLLLPAIFNGTVQDLQVAWIPSLNINAGSCLIH